MDNGGKWAGFQPDCMVIIAISQLGSHPYIGFIMRQEYCISAPRCITDR
jgi:hypothetical protein